MPRRRRFAPRAQSTQQSSHEESANVPSNDPIVGPGPSTELGSHEELASHERIDADMDTSNEADADVAPTQSSYKKKYNKYWTVNVIDENGNTRETRFRVHDLFAKTSEKIIVEWNTQNQPIGEAGGLLGQFLGQVSNNFDNFPICYEKWPLVPNTYKEHVWTNVIKEKFVLNDGRNKQYIMSSLGKKWKDNRADLFNAYYDPNADWEANVENRPESISRDHWAGFLTYRLRKSTTEMCQKNIENRRKQKVPHTLGSKTIARKRHEMEMELGRSCSRVELWNVAHKKNDGSFVNDEAQKQSEELTTHTQSCSETEAFTKVFGKEHPGRIRSMGHCVSPSQYVGSSSEEASSSQSNAKFEKINAEMNLLKTQMAFLLEHFGSQLPPGFPTNNQGSPAPVRRSVSDSHEPLSQDSRNHDPSSHA